jgi:hypothetical protein
VLSEHLLAASSNGGVGLMRDTRVLLSGLVASISARIRMCKLVLGHYPDPRDNAATIRRF